MRLQFVPQLVARNQMLNNQNIFALGGGVIGIILLMKLFPLRICWMLGKNSSAASGAGGMCRSSACI